jgi:hypothetical protein
MRPQIPSSWDDARISGMDESRSLDHLSGLFAIQSLTGGGRDCAGVDPASPHVTLLGLRLLSV